MSIVEFDGPLSWSLGASETGENTQCRGVGVVDTINPTASTHRHFVLSPVSLAPRDQDGCPSNSTIDINVRSLGEIGDTSLIRTVSYVPIKFSYIFPNKTSIIRTLHSVPSVLERFDFTS